MYHQRAQIVLDAIEVMKARSDIDPERIGLWGISQGGYVMPLVLSQSEDVAFMICVSCPGAAGDDQMAFQIVAQSFCGEGPREKSGELSRLLAELDIARTFETYEEYVHYRAVLDALADSLSLRAGVPGYVGGMAQGSASITMPKPTGPGSGQLRGLQDWRPEGGSARSARPPTCREGVNRNMQTERFYLAVRALDDDTQMD